MEIITYCVINIFTNLNLTCLRYWALVTFSILSNCSGRRKEFHQMRAYCDSNIKKKKYRTLICLELATLMLSFKAKISSVAHHHEPHHSRWPQQASTGWNSLCKSQGQLCGLENITRAPIDSGMSKRVRFKFSLNYPFNLRALLFK